MHITNEARFERPLQRHLTRKMALDGCLPTQSCPQSNWGLSETFHFRKPYIPFCKENKGVALSNISPSKAEHSEAYTFTFFFSVNFLKTENKRTMIFYTVNSNLYFRLVSLSTSLLSQNQFPVSCSWRYNCCTGLST